jgi:hypothetical protein
MHITHHLQGLDAIPTDLLPPLALLPVALRGEILTSPSIWPADEKISVIPTVLKQLCCRSSYMQEKRQSSQCILRNNLTEILRPEYFSHYMHQLPKYHM